MKFYIKHFGMQKIKRCLMFFSLSLTVYLFINPRYSELCSWSTSSSILG